MARHWWRVWLRLTTTHGSSNVSPATCWALNTTPGTKQLREAFKALLDTFLESGLGTTLIAVSTRPKKVSGRTDAFGRIANASFGDAISPANYRVADAPVDYPQLWDMWTFDWVQWNGSAQQPMARNIGEALGWAPR